MFLWRAPVPTGLGAGWAVYADSRGGGVHGIVESGGVSGTCGYSQPASPAAMEHGVTYLRFSGGCAGEDAGPDVSSVVQARLGVTSRRRVASLTPFVLGMAVEGADTYAIRETLAQATSHSILDCTTPSASCSLTSDSAPVFSKWTSLSWPGTRL